MSEKELLTIAENADMVVDGYAFTKVDNFFSILNLNKPTSAMTIFSDGKIIETNMDPIEQALVLSYWRRNAFLLESVENA